MSNYFIGVDLGTTSTKVVLFSQDGKVKASSNHLYDLYTDALGMAEEEPREIYNALLDGIRDVMQISAIDKSDLKAISFSSAMHSLIALDVNWQPLTRIITWADTRANVFTEKMKQDGVAQSIYQNTGTPIHPMAPLSKIQWLSSKLPDVFAKTVHFLDVKGYLFNQLFHVNKMDLSIASGTGLFNIFEKKWDTLALKTAGVFSEQLPEVVDAFHFESGIDSAIAKTIGIREDTPFVFGAGDGPLSNLGVAAIKPGIAAVTIGTSGAVRVVHNRPEIDPKGRTFTYALTNDLWVVGGPVNNGGVILRWARDNLFDAEKSTAALLKIDAYELLTDIAKKVPAGANGLLFHPYLGGERAPIWNADARGSFFGLTQQHTRSDMVRSVLEGVMFNIYSVALALEEVVGTLKEVRATGGFARSELWSRILSDVFDQTMTIPKDFESGALAAAVVAMKALGYVESLDIIETMVGEMKTYQPNEKNAAIYEELMPIFIRLSRQLNDEYAVISDFQRKHYKES